MSDRAAISAQLVDIRNIGMHKSVKLTLHVPAEQAELVMKIFGICILLLLLQVLPKCMKMVY